LPLWFVGAICYSYGDFDSLLRVKLGISFAIYKARVIKEEYSRISRKIKPIYEVSTDGDEVVKRLVKIYRK